MQKTKPPQNQPKNGVKVLSIHPFTFFCLLSVMCQLCRVALFHQKEEKSSAEAVKLLLYALQL